MQVILREDVEKVGLRGEIVDVAAGFARNYLLPRRLAEPATPGRVAEIGKVEANRARHQAQSFEHAQELVRTLEDEELRFDVQAGPTGTLFGSVTATDVADRIWEAKRVRVERRKIDLPDSIKRIGRYEVPVELFTDVTATLRLAVVPEGGELPPEVELEAAAAQDAEVSTSEEIDATPADVAAEMPADEFDRAVDAGVETPPETGPE
jgi:large subunit ribosomal protein L9